MNNVTESTAKCSLDIVTPTLNVGRHIENCVLSTLELRQAGASHFVIDGGSTDDTLHKIRLHGVKSFYLAPGNMYAAINHGIRDARSEWVTYINGDDILYSDSVMDALNELGRDCDVIYGNIDYIDSKGRFLHHFESAESQHFAGLFANGIMPIPQQGTLFRRSLWKNLDGFDCNFKYSADFDFFLRAFKAKARFGYLNKKPIAAFRLHPGQISQNYSDSMLSETHAALRNSDLKVGFYKKSAAKAMMRMRNLESYIVRFIRYSHLYKKRYLTRTISD